MRVPAIGVILALGLIIGSAGAGPAGADDGCAGDNCGVPSCWEASVRARPDMARIETITCRHADSAALLTPPAHGQVTDVASDPGAFAVHFGIRETADAPRNGDEVVLHLTGPGGAIDQHVPVEVIPTSENHPPVCSGNSTSQRSDGSAPVTVALQPMCYDPDGDEFTVDGSGPGTHLDAPLSVPALPGGNGWWTSWTSWWRYRTVTSSGSETTAIHATDIFGARSADAQLQVTVGPGVDRLPSCRPNPAMYLGSGVFPIYARPGQTRRFAVICNDADGDPFTTSVSSPPQHGTIAAFDIGALTSTYDGADRWIDATYVPEDDSGATDPFSVTASGERGDGRADMEIVPRDLPANGGGSCGWSGGQIVQDTAGELDVTCSDDDGDPLSAQVYGGAEHGKAGPIAIVPGPFGTQKIVVPYVPDAGFTGYDCVKVEVSDGHGLQFHLSLDINVITPPPVPVPLPAPPPLPTPIPTPPPLPHHGPASPSATASSVLGMATSALQTTQLRELNAARGARVLAPAHLSRRALRTRRRVPGLLVFCPSACNLRSRDELVIRGGHSTRGRWGQVISATGGQAQLVWIAIDRAQARALRPGVLSRLAVSVRLRVGGGPAVTRRLTIPVR